VVKDQISQRNSETMGLAEKSDQTRSDKETGQRPGSENEALIPNETNKVRSHKNYPKYLEYNKIIHVGIMYKI
jgi:hypothetical protein